MSAARWRQGALIVCFINWCWLAMMAVHESGHVLAAWSTGATVERVVLHPLAISRTDLGENPHPLVVSGAGAVIGCLLPVLVWLILRSLRLAVSPFARFFAGFCLVANGVYLGMGAWTGDGDAGDLIAAGATVWQLAVYGFFSTVCGLWCWHGQGQTFGLKGNADIITLRMIIVVASVLAFTVSMELILGPYPI